MPNWCENRMTVSGSKPAVAKFVELAKSEESVLSFDSLVPQDVNDPAYQNAKEAHAESLEPNPNFNWYDWNIDHWGTKWDCSEATCEVSDDGKAAWFNFLTPWGSPDELYKKLVELFPNLSFECYGYEGGQDYWYHFGGSKGQVEIEETKSVWDESRVENSILDRLSELGIDPDEIDIQQLRDNLCIELNEADSDISEYPYAGFEIINDDDEISELCEECKK